MQRHVWKQWGAGPFRGAAGVAVSSGGAASSLALGFRMVWAGSADSGDLVFGHNRLAAPHAPRFSAGVPKRIPLVHGQLLLGARHNVALWRHACRGADIAPDRIQPGAGFVLRL